MEYEEVEEVNVSPPIPGSPNPAGMDGIGMCQLTIDPVAVLISIVAANIPTSLPVMGDVNVPSI
jgi:hypothetical protein